MRHILILQPIINEAHDMHHASTYTKNIAHKTQRSHLKAYTSKIMANPILIMSIAVSRNRVLGFKN